MEMGCWLAPFEQEEVIKSLLLFELIKCSNKRDFPLKSGGFTDIYINLRDARSHPKALKYFSEVFANPIRRLKPDRICEIPHSISCIAGPLSIEADTPMITMREEEKKGRATKGRMIGACKERDRICIIDDVITDGASKIDPIRECQGKILEVSPLVVLVDRQQGWKKTFEKEGIDIPVWAGMTLHDIRKFLISHGYMKRCDKEVEEKNPLIVAFDGKSWEEILPLIDQLRTTGCILKVNDLAIYEGVKNLVPDLEVYGRVMVDIKSHDIPNTVANTLKRLRACPPWAITVHASGGETMLKAAVKAVEGTDTKILAVTVLTSIGEDGCTEIYKRQPLEAVKKFAEIAVDAGVHGFVCSAQEVADLKRMHPDKTFVTPGIRSPGVSKDEQERTATPAEALASGSDYIVMGRQVSDAPDPVAEVKRLLKEEIRR